MKSISACLLISISFATIFPTAVLAERSRRQQQQSASLLLDIGEPREARIAFAELEAAARAAITNPELVKKLKELDAIVDVGPANLPKVVAFITPLIATLQAGPSELSVWAVQRLTELRGLAQAGNHAGVETKLHKVLESLGAPALTRAAVLAWLSKLDVVVDAGNAAGSVKMIDEYLRDVVIPNSGALAPWTCDRLDAILIPLKKGDTAAADVLLKKLIADLSKP